MEYQQLVVLILVLFAAGAACRRVRASRQVFRAIDLLIVWLLFPAVIFSAVTKLAEVYLSPVILACFGLAVSSVLSAVVIAVKRIEMKKGAGLALNSCFMNYGYLGFPVVYAAVPDPGIGLPPLAVAALYGVVIGIFHLTIGVAFAIKASGKKIRPRVVAGELLAFPPVLVMVVALILVALGIYVHPAVRVPTIVHDVLDPLALPMTICMLLFVGYNMGFVHPRKYGVELLTAGSIRFIACPLITYFGAVAMGVSDVVLRSALLLSLMPPAMFNLVIAKHFRLDLELSGAMIFYLTLLSMFAITPLAVFLVVR